MLFGIDYGSKLAGTTVIARLENGEVSFSSSKKKKDADLFIKESLEHCKPTAVGIDAPLSIPKAYTQEGDDFFYRASDKALRAMSPMFLGGLTARAMKLKSEVLIPFYEVYPGALARELSLNQFNYKKADADYASMIEALDWGVDILEKPTNSHELDAILALFILWKIQHKKAISVGDADEGLIYY